ncbi:MAG: tRNA pseudouridine(13) synthase TruD [Pirellulaceae bacterium]|nr:tRNA pseudouridine(13) synthase TruD [Pirellulaceae bacterium]
MKLKRTVGDFQVEEQVALAPRGGPFALYRLTKESLGTPEAIDAILRRWNLGRGQVAYAGLKDRHARTTQFVTIQGGPRQKLTQTNLELEYLGQTGRPIHARDIVANRFVVVLRDLTAGELAAASQALETIATSGLPNYFDDQRFGSLGESGEFIAKPWCLGDYERALWLALAEPNVHDTPDDRQQKQLLRDYWNDWPACKAKLDRSHRRSIVTYLADKPGDFRRALALVRQDLRSIWLAAFQSHLWNQILATRIRQVCPPEQLARQTIGRRELPFFTTLAPEQAGDLTRLALPLPSARLHLEGTPLAVLYDQTLAAEGISLREIRVKYPRDSFFSKGERPAILRPGGVTSGAEPDELYADRQKLTLRFTLGRGSYATILVKRVSGLVLE